MTDKPASLGAVGGRLPTALLILTPTGDVIDCNKAASRLLGLSADELCQQNLANLVTPDSTTELRRYLALGATGTDMIPGTFSLPLTDRIEKYRCDTGLLEPAHGRTPGLLLMRIASRARATQRFQLLTERVQQLGRQVELRMRAEQLLDGQRQILESIVGEAPLLTILEKLALFIEQHSRARAIASILLYDRSSNRLQHAAAPSLPDDYCRAIDGLEIGPTVGSCGAAAFLNQPVSAQDITTHPNWIGYRELGVSAGVRSCFSIPITGNENEVLGTFALYYATARQPDTEDQRVAMLLARTAALAIERAHTIEEKTQSLARERGLRAEAEDANRSKDEFLALVSHELRNPLNAILGWAKVLTMDADPDTVTKGLGAIERNAILQSQLIEEILDYSRITAGKLKLAIEPADLKSLIATAIDSARPAARMKDITVACELDQLDDAAIALDSARIQQVLNNLLNNAIKFTPAGGKISVAVKQSNRHVRLRVSDNGCGIDPKFLPHMFERFQQQHRSQRENEGLGLGLAISRHIVQLHHGEITAQSDGRGKGATFEVRLPRRFAWKHDRDTTVTAAPNLDGLRLLAVDDAPDTRSLLETLFTAAGATVHVAENGQQALEQLRQHPPDVLLCDIGMPGLDGYAVVRQLRVEERGCDRPAIAAIALTAYARSRDRQRALEAGFDAHMAKPIDPAHLMQVVADVAASRK